MSHSSIRQVETSEDRLTIIAEFPSRDPISLFDSFAVPELLQKWWPPIAEVDPHPHGTYHFSWPKQDWHLRGKYTEYERGKRLGFTWRWDHEPFDDTKVNIMFEPLAKGGTRLTLNHGTYSLSEEGRKTRQGHVDGWMFFLEKLRSVG